MTNPIDRTAETMAPPTDREAETNPLASERPAIAPPPLSVAGERTSIKEMAAEDLLDMQRRIDAGLTELLGPGGRLELQTRAISAVVEGSAKSVGASFDMLAGEFRAFRDASQAKDREHDQRIATLERTLEAVKDQVARLEGELASLKAKNGAAAAPSATG